MSDIIKDQPTAIEQLPSESVLTLQEIGAVVGMNLVDSRININTHQIKDGRSRTSYYFPGNSLEITDPSALQSLVGKYSRINSVHIDCISSDEFPLEFGVGAERVVVIKADGYTRVFKAILNDETYLIPGEPLRVEMPQRLSTNAYPDRFGIDGILYES